MRIYHQLPFSILQPPFHLLIWRNISLEVLQERYYPTQEISNNFNFMSHYSKNKNHLCTFEVSVNGHQQERIPSIIKDMVKDAVALVTMALVKLLKRSYA